MEASGLIHHFAEALLESGRANGLDDATLIGERCSRGPWGGQDFRRFLTLVARHLNDEFYGLAKFPCPIGASEFGHELLVSSDNLGEALERYFRFYGLVSQGVTFRLLVAGDTARIEIVTADAGTDRHHFLVQWFGTKIKGLIQWLIGEEIVFDRIAFPHPPLVQLSEYARVFGTQCEFMQPALQLVFPSVYLRRRVVRGIADIEIARNYEGYDPLDLGNIDKKWCSRLKDAVLGCLTKSQAIPTLEEFASRFGVCSQTLRRRLKAEGSSYRNVKAEARRQMILDSLADDQISLGEVSIMAGFAEPNSLVRVMRNWTGLSPSEYRNQCQSYSFLPFFGNDLQQQPAQVHSQ